MNEYFKFALEKSSDMLWRKKMNSKQLAESKRKEKSILIKFMILKPYQKLKQILNMQISFFTWKIIALVFIYWPKTCEYRNAS